MTQSTSNHFQPTGIGSKRGQQPLSVMVHQEVDRYIRTKQDRPGWLRAAIMEKLQRDENLVIDVQSGQLVPSRNRTGD